MAREWRAFPYRRWLSAVVLVMTAGRPWCAKAVQSERDALTLDVAGVTFELVRVRAGTFLMGSEDGDSDERPVHEVRLSHDFYVGTTEVTVEQFEAFLQAPGYLAAEQKERWRMHRRGEGRPALLWRDKGFAQSGDHPVIFIDWHDAVAFCRWLSDRTGRAIRLPTEAEWEYACRAGTRTAYAGNLDEMAWCAGNSDGVTHPVGTKTPNAWGLYDMHGSVWEWCEDTYHRNYERAPADGSAWGDVADPRRIIRGGSWREHYGATTALAPRYLRSAYRHRLDPIYRGLDIGFRIVCAIEPAERPEETPQPAASIALDRTQAEPRPSTGEMPLSFTAEGATFELVHLAPGEFLMGSETGQPCERPVHPVRIARGFDMARTEVTVGQFLAFASATGYLTDVEKEGRVWSYRDGRWEGIASTDWFQPGFVQTGDNPVVCVSWYDAAAFCAWLSEQTGWEVRLPTETEWEYACRAGTTGDHAGDADVMGWHGYNSGLRTHPVGTKQPNAWGLYDMHGNAWEWCRDNWHENYEGAPADGSAWANPDNSDHVLRGGAWCRNPWVCRSAYRYHVWPDCPSVNMGFRIVRTCGGNCSDRSGRTAASN